MFPVIQISISGLDPDAKYIVVMDIVPVDDNRLIANTFVQEFTVVWLYPFLLCNVTAQRYMCMSLTGINSMIQNGWSAGRQNQPSRADCISTLILQPLVHSG